MSLRRRNENKKQLETEPERKKKKFGKEFAEDSER